jgi:histone RNA hairpin-binding protein
MDFSKEFEVDYAAPTAQEVQRETDPHRLAQRQKQVDIGKNTRAYARYCELVPKHRRRWFGKKPVDPRTPDISQICSKRAFDGQVQPFSQITLSCSTLALS